MKTPGNYFNSLVMAILFFSLIGGLVVHAQATLPDSLIFKSAILDTGEIFRQGYFTVFGHYTINSYFKESNGNEHVAYVDNYKLYYFKSTDDGITWSQQQVITAHEGDIYNCALTVDTAGKVFIGITVNNNFNYANPTAVSYGSEFYYDLYCVTNKTGSWISEPVYMHPGNYGPRIAGLFVDAGNNVHVLANYYGWNSLGGTAWEWIRNATSNLWGTRTTIAQFTDAALDRVIYDTYTIAPDQQGKVTVVMCRNISPTDVQKPRLFYVRYNGTSWSAPVTITDSIAVAWNRFDALVDPDGHTYIAYLKYKTPKVPELKVMKDFQPAQSVSLNLAPGDTLNYFRLHCNAEGLFTMYLYLNTKNSTIKTTFSNNAVDWGDPVPTPDKIKNYLGGMIVKTDTRKGYFTDYCKQIVAIAGPRSAQPYGPDTLLYGSIRLLALPSAPDLIWPENDVVIETKSALFNWTSSVPDVTQYRFQVDITSEFLSPVMDTIITDTTFLNDKIDGGQTYYWRVKAKNPRGWGEFSESNWFNASFVSINKEQNLPNNILEQNYPNPFNKRTTISWVLPKDSHVVLKVYDFTGREVRTLVDSELAKGEYKVQFDAGDWQAGVYFYQFQANGRIKTKKMIHLKN
jgi:hypothetical protein